MKEIDEFSGLLEGPRARGAFALRGLLESPWSLRIEAEAPLTVIAMVEGSCHLKHDNGEEVTLGVGDVAVTRGRNTILYPIFRIRRRQSLLCLGRIVGRLMAVRFMRK